MKRLGAGGYLGPVFLMLAVALPFLRGLPRAVTPVATMAGVGFVLWAMTSQVTRYLFPVLPLIALLAAVAATRLPKSLSIPTVGWCILYNLFLFVFLIETIGSYRVVSGAESREDYLTRRVSYYPAMTYLAASPPGTRVLFVGEGRTFYCPRDCVASTPLDAPMLDRFAAGTNGEQALVEKLRANGFTHLLVSGPELRRTHGVGADEVMRAHFPSGSPRLLFERQDVRVYGLPEGEDARSIQRQGVSRAN